MSNSPPGQRLRTELFHFRACPGVEMKWHISCLNPNIIIPFCTLLVLFTPKHKHNTSFCFLLVKIREFEMKRGTSRTFERRQTTVQVAAVDVEHQSFICFEATSNQFHPSRLQANHVAEGRRRAKSIWREEATYRRVEGEERRTCGWTDLQWKRTKWMKENNQFHHLKWNHGYLCEYSVLLRSLFSCKSKTCA